MSRSNWVAKKLRSFEEAVRLLEAHPLLGSVARGIEYRRVSLRGPAPRQTAYCWVEPPACVCINDALSIDRDQWLGLLALATLVFAIGGPRLLPWPNPLSDQAVTLAALHWWRSLKIGTLPEHLETPAGLAPLGRLPLNEIADRLRQMSATELCSKAWSLTRREDDPFMRAPPEIKRWRNERPAAHEQKFVQGLLESAQRTLQVHSENNLSSQRNSSPPNSVAARAKRWLISHYPLLGPLLVQFELVEDLAVCQRMRIQIAAIHVGLGEIYINPARKLDLETAKFVIAHEVLHAGLCHGSRRRGRDPYIWNVACDFVINDWLLSMGVGVPPDDGILVDEEFRGWAAEDIYLRLAGDLRVRRKLRTMRGTDCDVLDDAPNGYFTDRERFCQGALLQGLDHHEGSGRGYLPAGLVEEIRALNQSPIAWQAQLAQWLQERLPAPERRRTYARASRRQTATPDMPMPHHVSPEEQRPTHTFGVIIDTSGSMTREHLGKALGAISSYSQAQGVQQVRLVYCDATPFDVGFVPIESLAGRVSVQGRGGTVLQPAVHWLERQQDFPKNAPILVITDGLCDTELAVVRDHAFLLPQGGRLPFRTVKPVFHFS